jgi:hypothetical protein
VVSLIPRYWDTATGEKEAARLRELIPTLELRLDRDKRTATVEGRLPITDNISYSVKLALPPNYPIGIPTLWIDSGEIPWLMDRHVNVLTGEACLCVRSEYRLHWPSGSDLSAFVERLVRPYFAAQFFHDTHGYWPKDSARSHGRDGIIEAYQDLTAPLGDSSLLVIERVMRILAGKRRPQGHEPCPCGSGLVLRHCHSAVLRDLRDRVSSEHAAADLAVVFPPR